MYKIILKLNFISNILMDFLAHMLLADISFSNNYLMKFAIYEKCCMHSYEKKDWCKRESFLILKFKMFRLPNDNFNLRYVFTNELVSTTSLKLAPMLIYFDNFFFGLKVINPEIRYLSTVNLKNYQPKKTNFISNILATIFLIYQLSTRCLVIYQR